MGRRQAYVRKPNEGQGRRGRGAHPCPVVPTQRAGGDPSISKEPVPSNRAPESGAHFLAPATCFAMVVQLSLAP